MAGIVDDVRRYERVGFDSSVFIYHLEDSPRYAWLTQIVLDDLAKAAFAGVTSVLTLMEIAVKPLQLGMRLVADEYRVLLAHFPNLTIYEIDASIARLGAELRATHGLRTPDALQIAACLEGRATAFITNDKRLQRITELRVIVLDDYLDV